MNTPLPRLPSGQLSRPFAIYEHETNRVPELHVRDRAVVDFTVVARHRCRQGLAAALKAASLLALALRRVALVRTGGSDETRGILATNTSLGFRVDERWVTLAAPAR